MGCHRIANEARQEEYPEEQQNAPFAEVEENEAHVPLGFAKPPLIEGKGQEDEQREPPHEAKKWKYSLSPKREHQERKERNRKCPSNSHLDPLKPEEAHSAHLWSFLKPAVEKSGNGLCIDRSPDHFPARFLADDPSLDSRCGELRQDYLPVGDKILDATCLQNGDDVVIRQ
jgi:hypothetical protein